MFLVAAILAGLFALYLTLHSVQPLAESSTVSSEDWARIDDESTALLSKKDVLVDELRDLEFEAAMNKVDPDDLIRMRGLYEVQAVALMEEMDARSKAFDGRIDADVERVLKEAQLRRKAKSDAKQGEQPTVEGGVRSLAAGPDSVAHAAPSTVESAVDSGIKANAAASSDQCAQCGADLAPDSKFCDACGTPVGVTCSQCGVVNRTGAHFCKGCGHVLKEKSA